MSGCISSSGPETGKNHWHMEIFWSPIGLNGSGPEYRLYLYFNRVFFSTYIIYSFIIASYFWHLRNVSYFKKYVIIIKAYIVLLYTSPNTLINPTQNLILDIQLSILAGLIKCWADTPCSSSTYVSWHLVTVTQVKSNGHGYNALRTKLFKHKQFFHIYNICFYIISLFFKIIPIRHLSVRGRLWQNILFPSYCTIILPPI